MAWVRRSGSVRGDSVIGAIRIGALRADSEWKIVAGATGFIRR